MKMLKPETLRVDSSSVYILEGATISIFSLKNLSFIKKIGKSGD